MGRLHAAGLASGAPHPWNLVKTPEGFKMIDLSYKGPMLVCQGHDVLDMKRKFNIDARLDRWPLKVMTKMVFLKNWWHVWRREFKAKRRARRGGNQ